jgi:hypothetical protein
LIKSLSKLTKVILKKSHGNIESSITILPQVAIFLISIQLVFMQFAQSTDAYLLHGRVSSALLNAADKIEYKEEPLIGGGRVKVFSAVKSQPIFLSNLLTIKSQTNSIELDESSIN